MILKPEKTCGQLKRISCIVITSNFEFNSTCRERKHSQSHWNILTWPGLRTQIWTCCKKAVLMILWNVCGSKFVRLMDNSWMKNFPKDTGGPGSGLQKLKQLPDLIFFGLKRKSINGHRTYNAPKLRGIYSSVGTMEGSRKPIRTQGRSQRYPTEAAMPCKLRTKRRSATSRTTDDETTGSNKIQKTQHASWRLMNSREGVWNLLYQKIMKITSHNLVHKIVPMHQAMKIPDAKAAVDKEWGEAREVASVAI